MEPTNLNFPPPGAGDDVRLEAFLRRAPQILPDDGFSRRVLAALPAKQTTRLSLRTFLCILAGSAGAAFAWQQIARLGGLGTLSAKLQDSIDQLATALSQSATPAVMAQSLLIALAVTACSLLFAFWRELLMRWR